MNLVALPILIPFAAAVVTMLAPLRARRPLLIAGTVAQLLAGLALLGTVVQDDVVVLHVGGWVAPLGIALVADLLAALLVLLTGVVGLAVALQAVRQVDDTEVKAGSFALIPVLLAGVSAAFLAGDLFHLYVAFEVVLITSFALMGLGGNAARRAATVTYVLPSLFSSTLLLAGVGLLYGLTGTLNMADVGNRLAEIGPSFAVSGAAGLLAVAFALKSAAFPMHAWLPASYAQAPPAIAALFSALLSKIGVYALIRLTTLIMPGEASWLAPTLLVLAVPTMVLGVLGALGQWDMQKLLSFHVVSQVGYLLLAVGLATPLAWTAAVYYLLHNSVAKCGLLLVAGVVRARRGTDELKRLGGLARSEPLLGGLFLISALALAGLPPLSGFWAKFLVFGAGLEAGAIALVAVAAVVSVLTLLSMTKIWIHAFWNAAPDGAPGAGRRSDLAPLALLAVVTLLLGIAAGPAIGLAERSAAQLADSSAYIQAVLGGES